MAIDQIFNHFSLEEAWRHLHWLDEHARVRISGSGGDLRAAEYYADCLSQYGLDAHLDMYTTYRSMPQHGNLCVLSPDAFEIPCEACGHIVSTPNEGVEAELVDLGYGSREEYTGKDVKGRIVLTDITSGPGRPEKARIASDHGAIGIIFSNLGPPEYENIPMGAIKSVWGNPTRASIREVPQVAAIGITRADGDRLRVLCNQGQVRIRMVAQATRDWGPLPQTWGRLRAEQNPNGDVLVVGGHFDAWDPGMSDNAAGNALILELARIFSAHKSELRRDIIFAFWNGHEIGEITGSTWFLDNHWDEMDTHGVAYFNIDSVGFTGTSFFEAVSNTELMSFHQAVEKQVWGTPAARKRLTRANEQPFFPIGMPALEGSFRYSDEQIAAWDNASGGWWWHSTADTLDKVDQKPFHETFKIFAGYILEMCTRPVLPMDYLSVSKDLKTRILDVKTQADSAFTLDLPIDAFCKAAEHLNNKINQIVPTDETQIEQVNHTIKQLGRILMPAFETYGGRYDQDRVAHPALKSPLPILHDLQTYLDSEANSEQHQLIHTELLRGRNTLADALRRATNQIKVVV